MKNLTSKIGKYLSELATQLLKVLCEVMIYKTRISACAVWTFFKIVVLLIFLFSQVNILQISSILENNILFLWFFFYTCGASSQSLQVSLNVFSLFFAEELNLHNDSSERERKKVVALKQVCFYFVNPQ